MGVVQDLKSYYNYIKKYIYVILAIYAIIEIGLFMKIGMSNTLMFASSIFVTLFLILSLILMFKDFNTSSKIYAASIPIIPMVLYIMHRLHIVWLGEVVYIAYFGVFMFSIVNGYKKSEFDFLKLKTKYLKLMIVFGILIILAVISSIKSYYPIEAFKLVFLSMISVMVYAIAVLCYKEDQKEFFKDILFYLCLGVSISSGPDIVVTIYNLVFRSNNQHLYGVLGSNFMLGYTLVVLPFILIYALNKSISNKYHTEYKLLLLIQVINFSTQKSRGVLVSLAMCIFFVFIIDMKNWKKYIAISAIVFSCMGYNVSQRWDTQGITEGIKIDSLDSLVTSNAKIFSRLISQTKNRRPIWALAFGMIDDHTYFGVGPGHFKYYYLQYGGNPKKMYIDAHNIILNLVTEFGLLFAISFMLSWIGGGLKSLIDIIKNRKKDYREFKLPGIIGMVGLFAYGNSTGQSFMTSKDPISIVPAFVFMVIIIFTVYSEGTKKEN